MLISSNCVCSRSFLSSAASGSSSSSSLGLVTSARASATRCRWPPESWCGLRFANWPELDHLEHLADAPRDLGLRHAHLLEAEGDVLLDRHVREQRVRLEHHVHGLLVRRHVGHVDAVDVDLAAGRPLEAGQHPQQRRLAAARAAEQAEDLLLVDVERDVVDGDELAELLRDAIDPDEGLGVRIGPGLELELLVAG